MGITIKPARKPRLPPHPATANCQVTMRGISSSATLHPMLLTRPSFGLSMQGCKKGSRCLDQHTPYSISSVSIHLSISVVESLPVRMCGEE
ncbi:hypothetical protein JTE90_016252 [Oedothorax gibbosus]|uniref:Uncharacterized protein n=1 Tax=Oedothorax gibbosus TaxID=931172 RepID=A0AAV6VSQ7_9ARAC|nr:hypothetical protein JTE90_016252 [Oedothorax gibbosus]